jgi:hypothetical protein
VRLFLATSLVLLAAGGLLTLAADQGTPSEVREQAALGFVRENHPELAELLDLLKAMKPDQYERAINELWQTSKALGNMKKNDPRRYQAALDVWKAKSRVELVAAQMVGAPTAERESQLRTALDHQIAAELRQQKLERELLAARLKKLDAAIERLETKRGTLVETRYQNLLKKGQRARRMAAGRATPGGPATEKGDERE